LIPEPANNPSDNRRAGHGRRLEDWVSAGVLRALPDLGLGLIIADGDRHRVLHANDAVEPLLGYSLDELTQLPDVWGLLPPFERRQLRRHVRLESLGWDISSRYKTVFITKDGARLPVELSAFAFDDGGTTKFTLVFAATGAPVRDSVSA
jgi:PAS domain S-box-containing protein